MRSTIVAEKSGISAPLHSPSAPINRLETAAFWGAIGDSMGYKVAVIGATGNVGREMLNILEERQFPADEVFAIASRKSMGVEVSFGDKRLKCQNLETFDFRGVDFALMSAGSSVSKEWS